MKISVTQEHIDSGVRNACSRCPVALAIAEHVRNGIFVHVNRHLAFKNDKDKKYLWESVLLPENVLDLIHHFDRAGTVKPIEFDLQIPEEYLC